MLLPLLCVALVEDEEEEEILSVFRRLPGYVVSSPVISLIIVSVVFVLSFSIDIRATRFSLFLIGFAASIMAISSSSSLLLSPFANA